jgi:hypothetical protein
MEQDLPPKGATVKVPGAEVIVDNNDTWETIGMTVALILLVYAGIKAINLVFDRIKKRDSLF